MEKKMEENMEHSMEAGVTLRDNHQCCDPSFISGIILVNLGTSNRPRNNIGYCSGHVCSVMVHMNFMTGAVFPCASQKS